MLQVRKACLATLEKLRVKAQNNNITYLKPKNILPLFYYFLQDGSNQIREVISTLLAKDILIKYKIDGAVVHSLVWTSGRANAYRRFN